MPALGSRVPQFRRHLILVLLFAPVITAPLPAQTLDAVRASLSANLHDANIASSLAGLIVLADEYELSGAHYRINNDASTRLTSFALPLRRTFQAAASSAVGLYCEGVLGYAQARESSPDIYGGQLPGAETFVDSRWTTYGALVGLGPQFQVAKNLTVTVIADGGGSRLENDARYGGPGAAFSAQLLNRLAFNWSGYVLSGGGALRIDWQHSFGEHYELEFAARYDSRWTRTLGADDRALEFTSRAQFFTVRADLVGPTGIVISGRSLNWRSTLGGRAFVEGDMYEITALGMIGGTLELDTEHLLPLGPNASLSAAVLFGDRLWGYTVGVGLSF